MPHLFEKFKESSSGLGLGLYIVQRILQITARRFASPVSRARTSVAFRLARPEGALRTIRLVVADDVPVFREMVVCALELEDDLEVVGQASLNGSDAVEACRQHQPDVIILDVEMPRMNGVEATRQIVSPPNAGGDPDSF